MNEQQDIQTLLNEQHSIILDREGKLHDTDYIAAKIAEGAATKEEYEAEIVQRQQWRDEINQAQAVIARLEALQAEESMWNDLTNQENAKAMQEMADQVAAGF